MKVDIDPRVVNAQGVINPQRTTEVLRRIAQQLNALGDGQISATNAQTTFPTTGTYQQGDRILNSAPTEAGAAAAKYVITGWICTVAGTPGTWLQMRTLTGN